MHSAGGHSRAFVYFPARGTMASRAPAAPEPCLLSWEMASLGFLPYSQPTGIREELESARFLFSCSFTAFRVRFGPRAPCLQINWTRPRRGCSLRGSEAAHRSLRSGGSQTAYLMFLVWILVLENWHARRHHLLLPPLGVAACNSPNRKQSTLHH